MKIVLRNLFVPITRLHFLKDSCIFYSTSTNYQEEKIKVGKYNINYLRVGHGPHNVLCLPGALGSIWTDFKPQIEGFDREKFSLIVWDAPGYGKSRPPEREFTADYLGQDVEVALAFMKALKIPKFSVLGWSYGSISSIILAATHPEVVQKLVVWGTCTFILPHEIEVFKKMRDVRTWPENLRKPMVELYGEQRFSELWPCVVNAMETLYNNKFNIDYIFKKVSCDTFILHGAKDNLIDKSHAYYMARMQGCRIHVYPEGKHGIHIQYADDFNQRVQEFLLEC